MLQLSERPCKKQITTATGKCFAVCLQSNEISSEKGDRLWVFCVHALWIFKSEKALYIITTSPTYDSPSTLIISPPYFKN